MITRISPDEADDLLPLLGQVQALHVQAHADIFRADTPDAEMAAFLRAFLSRDAVTALAHRVGTGPVNGYLIYEIQTKGDSALKSARRVGFLHQIAVDAAHRRQGIALRLIDAMKQRLREAGIEQIASEHFAFNHPSSALMEAAGLHPLRITVAGRL